MNLILQRYHICTAVVKCFGIFFLLKGVFFFEVSAITFSEAYGGQWIYLVNLINSHKKYNRIYNRTGQYIEYCKDILQCLM